MAHTKVLVKFDFSESNIRTYGLEERFSHLQCAKCDLKLPRGAFGTKSIKITAVLFIGGSI